MARRLRILIDTNVLFSGLFWRGVPYLILSLLEEGRIKLFLPEQVILEAKEVIQKIKPEEKQPLDMFLKRFSRKIKQVKRPSEQEIVKAEKMLRDPDDAPILAAAFISKPDFFISGDEDLLTSEVRDQKDFIVCSSMEFLEQYIILEGEGLCKKAPDLYAKIVVYLAGLPENEYPLS